MPDRKASEKLSTLTFEWGSATLALMLVLLAIVCLFSTFASALKPPEFSAGDVKRPKIEIGLEQWATDLPEATDIQFHPDNPDRVFVLLKRGDLVLLSRSNPKQREKVLHLDVTTLSEMGLLGLAFHPDFSRNRKIYLNYNPAKGGRRTRVSEWQLNATFQPEKERVLLEIDQPYPNHKGGCLSFGADRMLYIGMGDGGLAGDPHEHGQNPKTLLGKMLRINVDAKEAGKEYAIPKDNPFRLDPKFAPEVWALGLRNPWRFSWDTRGRMIVADVGQNAWEEIDILEAGGNYGWRLREAAHCYTDGCPTKGFTDPWLEYNRDDGASVTGGYVYLGKRIPQLKDKYVFGDYVSGRIWAADLPSLRPGPTTTQFSALGMWKISPATFGRDADGEVYVSDFGHAVVYRLAPK